MGYCSRSIHLSSFDESMGGDRSFFSDRRVAQTYIARCVECFTWTHNKQVLVGNRRNCIQSKLAIYHAVYAKEIVWFRVGSMSHCGIFGRLNSNPDMTTSLCFRFYHQGGAAVWQIGSVQIRIQILYCLNNHNTVKGRYDMDSICRHFMLYWIREHWFR